MNVYPYFYFCYFIIQDLLLGETCCIDVMNSLNFTTPRPNWEKICCDNPRGAVVPPPKDLDDQQIGKISKQIERMPHMDEVKNY